MRALASRDDRARCLELQREIWGRDFDELVPPAILGIAEKLGGVAAGAFDGQRLAGFVLGFTGLADGEPMHWSHMLAVRESWRGRGLGRELKRYQRDRLLGLGVKRMQWTFDPLVARNAALNLNRLGALPEEYLRDLYGSGEGSELHRGLGTDRFVVRWQLETGERGRRAEAIGAAPCNVDPVDGTPLARPREVEGDVVWVEVPADIHAVLRADAASAASWRQSSRAAFEHGLERGYRVVGVDRLAGDGERWAYRLVRGTGGST
jgi:predicted GNAT superfamily acetyltransferase